MPLQEYESGWTHVTGDCIVTRHPAYLSGIILSVNDKDDWMDVYDGQGSGSGRKITRLKLPANTTLAIGFIRPVRCTEGISVAFKTDDSTATIFWFPVDTAATIIPEKEV